MNVEVPFADVPVGAKLVLRYETYAICVKDSPDSVQGIEGEQPGPDWFMGAINSTSIRAYVDDGKPYK